MPNRTAADDVHSTLPRWLSRIEIAAHGKAVRTQLAVARSLVDEVARQLSSQLHGPYLRAQLDDELRRLARLLIEEGTFEPSMIELGSASRNRRETSQ
jgi:hypothetical protein